MSDLIINAGAFNLATQALRRAGKDEIAEQLEKDCECVPDLVKQQQQRIAEQAEEITHLKHIMKSHDAVCEDLGKAIMERDDLSAHLERLRTSALNAICVMPSGEAKAELRDAFDESPITSLNAVKRESFAAGYQQGSNDHSSGYFDYDYLAKGKEIANQRYPDKEQER